jgi:ketosteroid isomerase-like protein
MSERSDAFEQTVARLSAAVTEAFNRGDVKTCAASYAQDAIMFLPDRAPVKGRNATEAVLMEFSTAGMILAPVEPMVIKSSSDMGYCAGTYQFEASPKKGRTAQENGKFVTVFMRQADNSWKAVLDSLMRDDDQ